MSLSVALRRPCRFPPLSIASSPVCIGRTSKRGALDAGANCLFDSMLIAAVKTLSDLASEDQLVPNPLNGIPYVRSRTLAARFSLESLQRWS